MDSKSNWLLHYSMLKLYIKEHGSIVGIDNYTIDGFNLGHWVKYQRRRYNGKVGKKLEQWQIELLDDLDIRWNYSEDTWNINFSYIEKFYEKFHHTKISRSYIVDGIHIGEWFNKERYFHNTKSDKIDGTKIHKYNMLEVDWAPHATSLLNKKITPNNKEEYYKTLDKVLDYVLDDLKYDGISIISDPVKQKQIEEEMIKRIWR